MLITLRNDFHNTEAVVRVPDWPAVLSKSQEYRLEKKLCGVKGCCCGGIRGKQDVEVTYDHIKTDALDRCGWFIWRDAIVLSAY